MRKHFVLTHGRSGSNFLANSLNLHPQVVNYGEVLGPWTLPHKVFGALKRVGWTWERYLDWLYEGFLPYFGAQAVSARSHLSKGKPIRFKARNTVRSIGMKDFAFLIYREGLMGYFESRPDIRVIYLHRANLFERYVSFLNMKKSGVVATEQVPATSTSIRIEINDMLEKISVYENEERQGEALVAALDPERVFRIDYASYFSSEEATNECHRQLFDFLDVDDIRVASKQKKIVHRPMHELIENYDAVATALDDAGYGEWL